MKKYIYFALSALVLLCVTSCNKDKWYQVPPEVSNYVLRFQGMAEKRSFDVNIEESGLIVEFKPIEEPQKSMLYYHDPIHIILDKTAWKNFNEELKALEIYHNLALGFLNRQTTFDRLPNGEWKSIMRGNNLEEESTETLNFFGFRQDYYINEIFYQDCISPWWADYSASYDSIKSRFPNELLSHDITLHEIDWTYTDPDLDTRYENGELIINNNDSDPKLMLTQIMDQLNDNFFIEAIIKIEEANSASFSGLVWGASESRAFYLNAYNHAFKNKMYNAFENYNYCHFTETNLSSFNPKGYTKISISKIDDKYYYFINENFIYFTDIHELYGNHFGFYIGENSTTHINRLSIKTE